MPTAAEPPAMHATDLSVSYGPKTVVHDAAFTVRPASITGLIGPNGSGKSTLLRAAAGIMKPRRGTARIHGQPVHDMPARQLARTLAFMPQHPVAPPGVTVRELVGYGRAPFNVWYKPPPRSDRQLIDALITRCDLDDLAERTVETLSGGERQRAWIAMALAQEPRVLMLDEPVSALDIGHQLEVMDLLTDINRERGTTLVIVLHDLNLAARYCTDLVAMVDGRVLAEGPTESVLTPETIRTCFKVEPRFHESPDGCTLCSFSRETTGATDNR